MAVRGLVAVDDRQGGARRWAVPAMVAPCRATAVLTAVAPLMPSLGVMAAVIANDALHGMESGTSREVAIDQAIGLVSALVIDLAIGLASALVIDPVIGSRSGLVSVSVIAPLIDPVIELENVSVIARKSGSATAPVPLTEIRTPSVRSLRTIAQVPDVSGIGTIVMAIDVVPGMNGASPPSAPVRATTMVVPLDRMQLRRSQRPRLQRMT